MWIGSELNHLCASATEESGPLVNNVPLVVSSQISRLSYLGVVVLKWSAVARFYLNSSNIRNELRGWITHGDIAAVWMTQLLALSTGSWKLANKQPLLMSTQISTST